MSDRFMQWQEFTCTATVEDGGQECGGFVVSSLIPFSRAVACGRITDEQRDWPDAWLEKLFADLPEVEGVTLLIVPCSECGTLYKIVQ